MKKALQTSICILLFLSFSSLAAQDISISGRVTDEKGEPLRDANVILKTLSIGGITDADGKYSFQVTGNLNKGQEAELAVRYIGYKTEVQKVTLGDKNLQIDFSMKVDVLNMSEVVVTGYGIGVEKEKLGVTISKVSNESIVGSDEGNVVSAMHGKVANVEVTSASGEPGAASYIRIRGAKTITGGTQPLFVVDGSPTNNLSLHGDADVGHAGVTEMNRMSDLNPEDIASIEILKGAAASAIYGSRAANGVVMITTKKGRPGGLSLSYKTSYSWDVINKTPELQTRWGQGIDGASSTTVPWSWGEKLAPGTAVYDHATEMFETGHVFENNLSISGGNEWTTYYLSLNRYANDGFIKGNSDYSRYSVRLNASQRINEKMQVSGNFAFADVSGDRIQKGSNVSGLLLGSWRTPPNFDNTQYLTPTGYHRSYRVQSPTQEAGSRGYDNPFFVVNKQINNSKVGRAFGNLQINYDPVKWIHTNYTLGNDYSSDERRTVFPKGSSSFPDGHIAREIYNYTETDGHFTAEATRYLKVANTRLNLLVGHQWNQRKLDQFTVYGDEIAVTGFDQLDNTSSYQPDEYQYTIRDESFFGLLSVDLYNQLYLTGALRNDGSSTFGQSKQRHWYPKASGAWEFTQFNRFSPLTKFLSFGKIRAAYGEAGQQPEEYLWQTAYVTDIYTDSDIQPNAGNSPFAWGYPGFHSSWIRGNTNINPQRSKEWETGIDLAFLNDRLGFNFTYYEDLTKDLIYQMPVAPSTGYQAQLKNAGEVSNRGVEIGLDLQPINTSNFTWDINAQWGRNKNRVIKLTGADHILLQGFETACYAQVGQPMSIFRGPDFVRFGRGIVVTNNSGEQIDIDATYSDWKQGDLYIAEDGFPLYDPEDRVIGDPNPDWTAGIRNTFKFYNKITLSVLVDIKQGGDVYNGTKGALLYFGVHKDTDVESADLEGIVRRGKQHVFSGAGPGAGTTVFLDQDNWYAFGLGNSFYGPCQPYVEDGSYVKLREIAISYKLTHPKLKLWTGLSDIDIRLSGRNLVTWTDYTGIDPETNISGNEDWRGLDYFNNPQTRSYVLSLRFNY
jgi:TonB-linked SusC/RagA family outer membrane protein